MKDWYTTKEAKGLTHRNTSISQGKKILLTVPQAKLHGEKKLEKSNVPPKDVSEAGVPEEYQQWEQQKAEANNKSTTKSATAKKDK